MESIFNKKLKNLTEKPPRWSLLSIKIQALIWSVLLKRNPIICSPPVKFAKFLGTPFFVLLQDTPGDCLLDQTVISTEAFVRRSSMK